MTSLIYNIGGKNFSQSTVLKKLNEGDYKGAAEAFELYNKVRKTEMKEGKKESKLVYSQGLMNRRKKEKELFLSSFYSE